MDIVSHSWQPGHVQFHAGVHYCIYTSRVRKEAIRSGLVQYTWARKHQSVQSIQMVWMARLPEIAILLILFTLPDWPNQEFPLTETYSKDTSHILFSTFIYSYLFSSFSPFTAIIPGCTLLFKQLTDVLFSLAWKGLYSLQLSSLLTDFSTSFSIEGLFNE